MLFLLLLRPAVRDHLNVKRLTPPSLLPLFSPLLLLSPGIQLIGLLLNLAARILGRTAVLVGSSDGALGLLGNRLGLGLDLFSLRVSQVLGRLLREELSGVSVCSVTDAV